jgi:hypothetical protein
MTDIKTGEPFGLDTVVLAKIDWALALGSKLNQPIEVFGAS